MKLDEEEVAVARALVPILDKVRPAISNAVGKPTDGSVTMGFGATSFGTGIAIGRRVHAQPGMLCVDLDWLRFLVAEAAAQEAAEATAQASVKVTSISVFSPDPAEPTNAITRVYLMAGRKQWYHDLPEGWLEVAFERFDYVECGIYEKPTPDLTDEDRAFMECHLEEPPGWIEPSPSCGTATDPS